MTTVYYDPPFDDEARRNDWYHGDLIVSSPSKASSPSASSQKSLVKEAFAPLDPETRSSISRWRNMPRSSASCRRPLSTIPRPKTLCAISSTMRAIVDIEKSTYTRCQSCAARRANGAFDLPGIACFASASPTRRRQRCPRKSIIDYNTAAPDNTITFLHHNISNSSKKLSQLQFPVQQQHHQEPRKP